MVQAAFRRLAGKVAVIAGGAGGIGTATSRRLAAEGAAVMVGDLNAGAAAAVAQTIMDAGGSATSCGVDLGDPASISQLFDNAVASFGGVDLLHCNAATTGGTPGDSDALDVSLETWNTVLNVNLTGYFHCTRAALPLMLARGGGAIVYTSSGAAFTGEATRVAYGVSKAGLHALARHVALRWGKEGIRANAVAPGLVLTPAASHLPQSIKDGLLAKTPSPRLGDPEDIAAMVAMLLSQDGAWINGQAFGVDGGYYMR